MSTPSNKPLFSGNIAETPFPKLLYEICSVGLSGSLIISRGKARKEITFDHGRPAQVTSNLLQEVLGRYLVVSGKISEEDYQQTLDEAFKSHRLHGDIMVERGVLNKEDLPAHLREQSMAKLLNIFKWPDGQYAFYQRNLLHPIKSDFEQVSPETVIFMGIKRHYSIDRLIAAVEPYKSSYIYPGSKKSRFIEIYKPTEDEQWFLDLADGTKTVNETIEMSPFEFFDSYRLIYGGIVTDVLFVKDVSEKAPLNESAPSPGDFATEIVATYHAMSVKNYFEILGVDENASSQDIKRAYLKLAKEYHPDTLGPQALPFIEKTANRIFDLVSTAYRVLSDENDRNQYIRSLSSPDDKGAIEKTNDIINAELLFQKGRVFLKKRNFPSARESFEWAVKLVPDEGEYLAYLGWVIFLSAEDKHSDDALAGVRYLKKAVFLNPSLENAQLFLGMIYKTQNLKDVAMLHFKKALEINPDSVEAKREITALGMKSNKEDTRAFFGSRNKT